MREQVVASPAKINLHLQVLGKRPDGYHEIETIFLRIPLEDEMRIFIEGKGITLISSHPCFPLDSSNTVVRAYQLLSERVGGLPGIRVELEKRIPVGGGLGGGSSNAAAFLVAVNELLGLALSREDLLELGKRVGADVPFFILGAYAAVGKGIGDALEPLESAVKGYLLLVFPPLSVSTSWAYSSLSFPLTPPCTDINILALLLRKGDLAELALRVFNHLEGPVFDRYSLLARIKGGLLGKGALLALMSGSGSTLFGLFNEEGKAREAARWASGKGWGVCLVPLGEVGV